MLGVNVEDKVFERRIEQARLNPRRRPDAAVTDPEPASAGDFTDNHRMWEELWKETRFWVTLDPSVRARKVTRSRARYECLLELSKRAIDYVRQMSHFAGDDRMATKIGELEHKLQDMQEQYATNPDVLNLDHYARDVKGLINDATKVDLGVPELLTTGLVTELLEISHMMQETVLEMSLYLAGSQLWVSTQKMRFPSTSAHTMQKVINQGIVQSIGLIDELCDALNRLEPHAIPADKPVIIARMRELGKIKAAYEPVVAHSRVVRVPPTSELVAERARELQKDPLLYKAWAKRRGRRSRKPE